MRSIAYPPLFKMKRMGFQIMPQKVGKGLDGELQVAFTGHENVPVHPTSFLICYEGANRRPSGEANGAENWLGECSEAFGKARFIDTNLTCTSLNHKNIVGLDEACKPRLQPCLRHVPTWYGGFQLRVWSASHRALHARSNFNGVD